MRNSGIKSVLEPVYEVKVDSVPILAIWKNDSAHMKKNYDIREISSELEGCIEDLDID